MVNLSNKWFLRCVTVALVIGIKLPSTEGLNCWVCDGYDRVENQCSPTNEGKSINCPANNMCMLVAETEAGGRLFITRKCAEGIPASKAGKCDAPESPKNVTRCYCNTTNDCNRDKIDGVGGNTSGGGGDSAEGGLSTLAIIVIVAVVLALLVGGGLGYRWYSGRNRGSAIPSDG